MLVNFVSVSRVRESRTHGLIRGGCRKAVAYFLNEQDKSHERKRFSFYRRIFRIFHFFCGCAIMEAIRRIKEGN